MSDTHTAVRVSHWSSRLLTMRYNLKLPPTSLLPTSLQLRQLLLLLLLQGLLLLLTTMMSQRHESAEE